MLGKLFLTTLSLSAFTFGGGYVIVPLMRKRFVEKLRWIEEDEMLDLVAIAQSTPGSIAVNCAILVGYKMFGILGALVSLLGTIIPPFAIISVVALAYNFIRDNKIVAMIMLGMQAGIAAVIIDVVINLAKNVLKKKSLVALAVMLVSTTLVIVLDVNVMFILAGCIGVGVVTIVVEYAQKKKLLKQPAHGADLDMFVWGEAPDGQETTTTADSSQKANGENDSGVADEPISAKNEVKHSKSIDKDTVCAEEEEKCNVCLGDDKAAKSEKSSPILHEEDDGAGGET